MQQVSNEWKSAHEQLLVPESYVELRLTVSDPDALADASASSNGEEAFSNAPSIVKDTEKSPTRFATLEKNIWALDGSFSILPDTPEPEKEGYIGPVLSGDDGTFDTPPKLIMSFSQVFTPIIPGITILWATAYNEWADTFTVTAYNGSAIVAHTEVSGNRSLESVVSLDIQDYDRIEVSVLKWCLPSRRARVQRLAIGIEKVYGKSELLNFSHSMSVDPLSAVLPKSEITFEIVNLNGEYNPDNPSGAEKYLMERQRITARYGYRLNGSVEWIPAGTFYMSEWETPQNGISATFTARDVLEYMSDPYSGQTTGTLMDIAISALEQADLPSLSSKIPKWVVDESLSGLAPAVNADLSGNSIMEVLQYVANAACCVFFQDRNGTVHIEPLPAGETDYRIGPFVSYANSEISLTKQLKAIDVNSGQYVLSVGIVGETQKLDNPLISDERAPSVANWAADVLRNRKLLSGNFRADPRLDALDRVTNENQFAETVVLVTEVSYTYNGAFRGAYEGRAGV